MAKCDIKRVRNYKYILLFVFTLQVRSTNNAQTQVIIFVVFVAKFEHDTATIVGRDRLVLVVPGTLLDPRRG